MIGRVTRKFMKPNTRLFSEAVKKARMEVSVRSPYTTFLADFDGFTRIITRTNEAALVIQNQMPPATYILPAGKLEVKFAQEVEGTSGDYIHTGGWAVIHPDNTCEISLMECFEREELSQEGLVDYEVEDAGEGPEAAYVEKIRRSAHSAVLRNM